MNDHIPSFWANKAGDIVGVCMGDKHNPTLIWYGDSHDLERAKELTRRLNEAVSAWLDVSYA